MIFIHEIADVFQLAPPSPEGIHYAAKQIADADVLMHDLKVMLINALVSGSPPAGMLWGRLDNPSVTAGYSRAELAVLEQLGYNPIMLETIRDRSPVVWGFNFRTGLGGCSMQTVPMWRNQGFTNEFLDYLVRSLWTTPNTITLNMPTTTSVAASQASPEAVEALPIHRAIRAQSGQIGLFNRLL